MILYSYISGTLHFSEKEFSFLCDRGKNIRKLKHGTENLSSLYRNYASQSSTSNSSSKDKFATEMSLFKLYMNPATEKINMSHFLLALEKTGLRRTDPRLKELVDGLEELHCKIGDEGTTPENIDLSFDSFQRLIEKNLVLITQAFTQKLIVPDFLDFCTHLKDIYRRCKNNNKVLNNTDNV
jgi:hypothetical protein